MEKPYPENHHGKNLTKMKLLDRYISKKFFATFFVVLAVFILLVIIIHAVENVSHFKKHQLSFYQVFKYYCVLVPYLVNLLVPIIVFCTTIWVTTRLAKRSEIIALLSGGISLHRIITPYIMIALLLTGANFYLTGWVLADANKERVAFETKYLDMGFFVRSDYVQLKAGPDQYLHIAKYYGYNNTGYDVSLDTFKNNALVERLHAERIQWHPTGQTWILRSWQKRTLFPKHEVLTTGDSLTISLEVNPEDFEINPNLKDGLTLPELKLHIQKLIYKGSESVRFFIAEQHIRYMTPFAIIILIVLGFLVALHKPRGSIGRRITLGSILACFYIVLFLSAKIVVEAQSEHPLLDIWLPNIIFSILCMTFYRLVPK
ncbi:MAG: LptF/LptG family permease [Candidatus Cardinium sp.]|uniref:LptF/LptG family permease n=1 Tax=Cardinium endosymbiont of Dermatophagoides farinae TaxID=2597823 RepID=UPI0011840155|nr:LptF/LptG family permease [Cardinium endosymbiont of Dermatophagoides farinae]TSJ81326.1 YjgP/YjgQ family permease [Cardinium endosymbiont of Dermatophagoides farinae]UWW97389.1 MAG: LptF/LptG family permease [Candidatus Cardinium sp.]